MNTVSVSRKKVYKLGAGIGNNSSILFFWNGTNLGTIDMDRVNNAISDTSYVPFVNRDLRFENVAGNARLTARNGRAYFHINGVDSAFAAEIRVVNN